MNEETKEKLDEEIKDYLHKQGATELAEKISEVSNQEQSRLIIDKLVLLHGKRWGERLFN